MRLKKNDGIAKFPESELYTVIIYDFTQNQVMIFPTGPAPKPLCGFGGVGAGRKNIDENQWVYNRAYYISVYIIGFPTYQSPE